MYYGKNNIGFGELRTIITLAYVTLRDDGAKSGKAIAIIYFLQCKTTFGMPHIPQGLLACKFGPCKFGPSVGPEFPRHPLSTHKRERLVLVHNP